MNYYIIGLGGIGASYVARLLRHQGHTVAGTDMKDSELLHELADEGITVHVGHSSEYISDTIDQVLISPAVEIAKPEDYLRAKELGLPMMTWQEALKDITKDHITIAVCGTHGKSTTTAMLGVAMQELGMDPTVLVGTKVPQFGNKNIRLGSSPYLVIEADEYNENFLHYIPTWILCTSLEPDHLDYYKTEARYIQGFLSFFSQAQGHGGLITHSECLKQFRCYEVLPSIRTLVTDGTLPDLQWNILGKHNRENAALVFEVIQMLADYSDQEILQAIGVFEGTWRRQEYLGIYNGVKIYDDYAHHPSELRATLSALREAYPEEYITCLFQAHQYSRTIAFLDDFALSFADADEVWVMDIYASRDTQEDMEKMNAEILAKAIGKEKDRVHYVGNLSEAAEYTSKHLKKGVFVTCGAGDVTEISRKLAAL